MAMSVMIPKDCNPFPPRPPSTPPHAFLFLFPCDVCVTPDSHTLYSSQSCKGCDSATSQPPPPPPQFLLLVVRHVMGREGAGLHGRFVHSVRFRHPAMLITMTADSMVTSVILVILTNTSVHHGLVLASLIAMPADTMDMSLSFSSF